MLCRRKIERRKTRLGGEALRRRPGDAEEKKMSAHAATRLYSTVEVTILHPRSRQRWYTGLQV